MRLLVGLTTLTGSVERYAERFDLIEFRADPSKMPSPKALRKMRALAPNLLFSSLLPPRLTAAALSQPSALDPLQGALEQMAWIVLQTGPEVGPSRRSRGQLESLVQKLGREGRRIAWEPHGLWEEEQARKQAHELGISYVQDLSMSEGFDEELVYTRLRTPGPGSNLRASALEKLAEGLSGTEEALVVIEGHPTQRARARVRSALAGLSADSTDEDFAGDELDDEDELDEEDGFDALEDDSEDEDSEDED